jgi:hypothetical protein
LAFAAAGCPGSVDPSLVPTGKGGNTGGGGSGGTSAQMCDPAPIYMTKICANAGCHDAVGTSANFDMASPDWQTHLVGVNPKGGGALASMCGSNGPYLVPNMLPARGLFIDKLKDGTTPACGVLMPQVGTKLSPAELDCVQAWANGLVAGGGTAAAPAADDGDEGGSDTAPGGAP